MLSEHDFLTPDQCARTRDIVHGLREHWVNRAMGYLPFYTLGAASYLDAKSDASLYYQAAAKSNPILKSHFPQLYETLLDTISGILGVQTAFAPELALPGFHIFLAHRSFENPIASTHFDLQYEPLKWEYDEVDFDHPISFTCAITLPHGGCGMNYWDIERNETKELKKNDLERLRQSKETHYFSYTLGKLILHRGLILHQIAPCKDIKPTDERITLQGHGLVCDGIMRLYW